MDRDMDRDMDVDVDIGRSRCFSTFFPFDIFSTRRPVLSHLTFCPIRRFFHSAFFPFGVSYYSTFCPIRRFFHSMFNPIQRFFHSTFYRSTFCTFGVCYFDILSVNRIYNAVDAIHKSSDSLYSTVWSNTLFYITESTDPGGGVTMIYVFCFFKIINSIMTVG
jgi:hypothetical protein